jgi:hypothetical protein
VRRGLVNWFEGCAVFYILARGNKCPPFADTSELSLVTGDHGCRVIKKPCDTLGNVITQVTGAGSKARPGFELVTSL